MSEFNIASLGGKGDGIHDNSGSFASAFKAIKEAGGGTLRVPKGNWLTGPLDIYSNTTLILDEEAIISFIPEPERYPPVLTRWEGIECFAMHPCVFAARQENITIKGSGILDGNGQPWWDTLKEKKRLCQDKPQSPEELVLAGLNTGYENQPGGGGGRGIQFLRPPLVQFFNCSNITIDGITLKNSPFWTLHPLYCINVNLLNISIFNPPDAPNTDGMDIDSCEDVLVENCQISVGDDGIALKSGSGEDGIRVGKPCRKITVRGCKVENGHGGIVIGSETAAGIYNVLAENCLFKGTDRGIRIKTRRGRGGHIENLEFKNLVMEDNLCPIAVNMFYRCGANETDRFFSQEALPVKEDTPSIKNINISGIRASNCRASAGFIAGLPESPVENLSVLHSIFSTDEQSGISPDESDMFLGIPTVNEKSIRLLNVKNVEFNNVLVQGPAETFIYY